MLHVSTRSFRIKFDVDRIKHEYDLFGRIPILLRIVRSFLPYKINGKSLLLVCTYSKNSFDPLITLASQ